MKSRKPRRKRRSPYRLPDLTNGVRKLRVDLGYRMPYSGHRQRYAVLERAQAEAIVHALTGHPHVRL